MLRHLPNLLTCCNLLCGSIGIVYVLENKGVPGAYFVWAAALFDFLDGFTARALKVSSPIGKELDSLADVISFGLLPAIVMYKFWGSNAGDLFPLLSFSIVAFSALRLAIFNIDESQSDSFLGLPTPANALWITALPLIDGPINSWLTQPWVLAILILLSSFLLVSPIRLFALKFKNYSWRDNKIKFSFFVTALALLVLLNVAALPLIILLYVGLSLAIHTFSK